MKKAVVQTLDLSSERWSVLPALWHLTPDGWRRQGTLLPVEFNVLPEKDAQWRELAVNAKARTGADVALYVIPGMNDGTRPARTQVDLTPLAE